MTLKNLKVGDTVKIIGFTADNTGYRNKLLEMGLIPGTTFILRRIAPLGDPIEIEIRGFSLVLRKDEADILQLQKISPCPP